VGSRHGRCTSEAPRKEGTLGGEVPSTTGGPLARRLRAEDLIAPLEPEFLLGYLDLAITGVLDYSKYERVYLGPWWDLPSEKGTTYTRAWKRAVLRRIPAQGAQHWGHIYLVVRDGEGRLELRRERGVLGMKGPEAEVTELVLREGRPMLSLAYRPSTLEHSEELDSFARDIAARFERQLD
jgi:hypothetical protein